MENRPEGLTLFVGLGRMGEPMVRRYAATRPTLVHDIDRETTRRISADLGVDALETLEHPPPEVDAVILMLPNSRIVEPLLLGDGETTGLLARLTAGGLVIDMGSSEPASTRRLAQAAAGRGLGYVDAPVSGGVSKAVTGELAIMVGGDPEAVHRAVPHLHPLGTQVVQVGPSGAGHAAKALNNLLSATNLAAAAEILCVAQRAGIEPSVMVDVLNSSTGRSQATEVKYPQHVLTGSFASGFELDLMLKDLAIAAGLAQEQELSTPITASTVRTLTEARRLLDAPGLDHTEIVRYYEDANAALLRGDGASRTERNHP
jgi:3-hydroxyisobutyrate dehydrogenase